MSNKKSKDICSPYSYIHADSFTCFTNENIDFLKSQWNMRHPNQLIKSTDVKDIWNELNTYMKQYLCKNERCWVRKLITNMEIKQNLFHESFAPTMPEHWNDKPYAWLSDMDISRVMRQYEEAYSDFMFIGPSPIDYHVYDSKRQQYVWDELKNFNLQKYLDLRPSKTKLGIIFNLDTHTGRGTHWVALYIDITQGKMYYFDSNGTSIPANIKRLTDEIKRQGALHDIRFTLSSNYPNEHQKKNGECGVYVLFFISQMLTLNNWSLFKHQQISDEEVHTYRKKFFNASK